MRTPVRKILQCVGEAYGLTLEELYGPSRKRRHARPRQIAMYLARRLTRLSTTRIGQQLNRDHSTIVIGNQRIKGLIARDADFAAKVEELRAQLTGEP